MFETQKDHVIIYGAHNKRTPKEVITGNLDGIIIEWPAEVKSTPGYFTDMGKIFLPQFTAPVEYAQERGLPIYNTDLGLNLLAYINPLLLASVPARDMVMAHKAEWLMNNVNINRLAHFLGFMHTGVEDQLYRKPEERVEDIRRHKLLLKVLVRSRTIPAITRYDFNGLKWELSQIFEVPDMKF